ncbi:hypothetical protein [Streptomyces sp. NPDC056982]|uniref:hypothetical protein n=1 Tax=Streptomyces sp. NPDC056982 TaxID=3345986 RepID=UPI0036387C95
MKNTCHRHPHIRFMAECWVCKQELHDQAEHNKRLSALAAAEREVAAKVGLALGWGQYWKPDTFVGETATHILMWSQHELNAVYERVGGTVTSRPVERIDDDVPWMATEITLTVDVPGVGSVQLVTGWADGIGGHDLPAMAQIAGADLIAA